MMDNMSLGFAPQKQIDTSLQRYNETHQPKKYKILPIQSPLL